MIGPIRLLLLAVDGGILPLISTQFKQEVKLKNVLCDVFETVHKVGSHLYMPVQKADNAVKVLTTLMRETQIKEGLHGLLILLCCNFFKACNRAKCIPISFYYRMF